MASRVDICKKATFLLIGLFTVTSAVEITDCGSSLTGASYSISGCDDEPQCSFVVGTNVTLNATFTADRVITSSKIVIVGHLSFFRVPFLINPPEACNNWGLNCPTEINSVQTLQITLPIKWYYPRISVVVQLSLFDQEGVNLICSKFPAKIVSSN